jgi:bifunctional non-homologous end joining protein LigD
VGTTSRPPKWIKPQLTRLVAEAPTGGGWLHEIKYDGYRMHARIADGQIKLLTRTGLDWSYRYRRTIEALGSFPAKSAYLDGELCALRPDGVPAFSRLQAAMDENRTDQLILFVFDLLYLNGESTAQLPLLERKQRLQELFKKEMPALRYSEHVVGDGPRFRQHACQLGLEGAISKRADQPYAPGDRGLWVKSKCLTARSSWLSAGRIRKEADRTLVRCFSATTPKTADCTTRGAPEPESPRWSSSAWRRCWHRYRSHVCPCRSRLRATAGSVALCSFPASIGCVRKWSSKSLI